MLLFNRYFARQNEVTFISAQPSYVELCLDRWDPHLIISGVNVPVTFGYNPEENINTVNIAGIECKIWEGPEGIQVHDPREKTINYNKVLFDCVDNEDGSVSYSIKEIDPLFNYKAKSIEVTVRGYLEKFNKRANFFSEIGDMVEILPLHDGTMNYGDRDVIFPVIFSTWEDWWGHSPRNIVIEGNFPIHLSKNNKMSFGHDVNWGYSGQSIPVNVPDLNFSFYDDRNILYHEGIRIPNAGMSFMSIRDIVGKEYLENFLMSLFHQAFFAKHTNNLAIDNR